MACLPRMTRSGFSWSTSALSSLAMASGSGMGSLSAVAMWNALSAPSARAVRSTSVALDGPMVTTEMSSIASLCFSRNRTASSTAISQKGF